MHRALNDAQSNSAGSQHDHRSPLLDFGRIYHGPIASHDGAAKNCGGGKGDLDVDLDHRPLRNDGVGGHGAEIE